MKHTATAFILLLSLLYGIVGSAQILGFLKIYQAWLAIPLAIALAGGVVWGMLHFGGWKFFSEILGEDYSLPETTNQKAFLGPVLLAAGLLLVGVLIIWPVALWPYTPISETLEWDAGAYHFPKALEMVRTGSAWDLTISYGEYPFGYESLFAFAALLTRDGSLFGAAHLLTCLYLVMTFWLLMRRYTGLPAGASLFLTSFILLSGYFSQIESNLWWVFRPLLYTIGKNDLFLGASLLGVILFAPVGRRENQQSVNVFGLGVASMIALSIKPNAFPVVLAAWLWTAFVLFRKQGRRAVKLFLIAALVALPGLFWVLRNLLAQGQIISAGALDLQRFSIVNNLTNPYFYQNIPQDLIRVCLIFIVSAVLSVFFKHISWPVVIAAGILLLSFMATPATAYLGDTQTRPLIAWRFAIAALVFVFILPVLWFAPLLRKAYAWINRTVAVQALAGVAAAVVCLGFIWLNKPILKLNPGNQIVLKDQFRQPVGVQGYHSAYDYVHQNIRDSVVWVENGLPYYVYGPGFTNTTTRSRKADYELVFQTNWYGGDPAYPEIVNDPNWQVNWTIIYEDPQGRVYQRKQ